MRILMFGWDYPPKRNGGLGVACFGLTRELAAQGASIIYVLPRQQTVVGPHRFIFASDDTTPVTYYSVRSGIQPYQQSGSFVHSIGEDGSIAVSTKTMLAEVHLYAAAAARIANTEQFNVIHAHDWTAYLAGVRAKEVSGKPLVLHVHATSFDQAASDNIDPVIYNIEYTAFTAADSIVTVSDYTKQLIVRKFGIDVNKISVVHNGADLSAVTEYRPSLAALKAAGKKIVLYHGRITIQKGVDYFVAAAAKVISVEPNVVFVISGWGDMQEKIIEQVGSQGLSGHVLFAGALWDEDRDRMYQSADLVVMPSVSEPFGLVPLEALVHDAPSLISKQSGVGEVLTHVLKVDFWDINEMANQIVAALRYPALRTQLVKEGKKQLLYISWQVAAEKVIALYKKLLAKFSNV